jgi:hypothetical protein
MHERRTSSSMVAHEQRTLSPAAREENHIPGKARVEDPISGGAKDNAATVSRSGWCGVVAAAGWGSWTGEKENERRERMGGEGCTDAGPGHKKLNAVDIKFGSGHLS